MKYIDEQNNELIIKKQKNKKDTEFKKMMRKLKKYEIFWETKNKTKRKV